MNAAAPQTLIVRRDHDVARRDEGLDRGQAVVGPRIAADEEVLVERRRAGSTSWDGPQFSAVPVVPCPQETIGRPPFGVSPVGATTSPVTTVGRPRTSDET